MYEKVKVNIIMKNWYNLTKIDFTDNDINKDAIRTNEKNSVVVVTW